jgi:subtilisin family serine protease
MGKSALALIAIALALLPAWYSSTSSGLADGGPNPPIVESGLSAPSSLAAPGQISVRFKAGVSDAAIGSLHSRRGARVVEKQALSGLQRLAIPPGRSLDATLAAYRRSPLVAEANVTRIAQIFDTPNDTNYPHQWHMRSTSGGMWADTAWDLAPNRGQGVVVVVIDTGVAYEDYNGSLNGSPQTFKRAPDLATTPFVFPYDFSNNDAHPNDDHGHGSHVTGTIRQDTNNAYGVAGVAYNSTIMPLKVLDNTGDGVADDIVEALYYATNNGADVINMSIGFPGSGTPDANGVVCADIVGLNTALDYAYNNGVVLVAAAGNDGGIVSCPAAHPRVISVGATRFDALATFYSNNGSELDIAAPGGDPYVDQSGDGYADGVLQETFCYDASILLYFDLYGTFCNVYQSGTSMASPHVAGTAALLLGENPSLTPDQVRSYLQSTARDGGATGWDPNYGWGVLDAAGALASLLGVPVPEPQPFPGLDAPTNLAATATSSSKVNLSWTDNATAEVGFKLDRSTDGVNFTQLLTLPANTTSYSNTNLAASTTYHYRLRAYTGPEHSAFSNTASAVTQPPPAAPTNLAAIAVSTSRINLTWTDNATNEAAFKVERSADGVNFAQIALLLANTTSYASTNLTAATTYTFRVSAYEGSNYSAFSNYAAATTQAAPAAPSSLSATTVSSSKINLTWTDNSTNEGGFRVERTTDGVSFTLVATLGVNVASYSNTNLTAATTYTYRVRAYEGPNNSAFSNTASATTQAAPAAPTNLTATAASTSKINLAWTDNSSNEAGFSLERSTDGVNFTLAASLAANATAYSNTSLNAATTYTYRIRSHDVPNYSAFSNTASATTQAIPAAPSNLTATAVSPSKINLAWSDNSNNEGGFKLERSTDGVSFLQIATFVANTTSWSNTSLIAGTTYTYRIRAYEGTNNSAFSNTASATTTGAPAAPSNLTATAVSSSRINLAWTDNATNEAGFKLERSTDGVSFTQVAVLTANVTSYANSSLPASTTYIYRVRAYEGTNNSAFSNTATATTQPPPAAPSNLTATAAPGKKINLAWTDNATNEAGFKLERSSDGVSFTQLGILGANTTSYSNGGLTSGVTYYYRVRAYDGTNHSGYSNVAFATVN